MSNGLNPVRYKKILDIINTAGTENREYYRDILKRTFEDDLMASPEYNSSSHDFHIEFKGIYSISRTFPTVKWIDKYDIDHHITFCNDYYVFDNVRILY